MAKKIAKAPVEWVDGKIVLRAPPANPIYGRGNVRLSYSMLNFEMPRSLFFWFFNLLDENHKTKVNSKHSFVSYISPEAAKLLNSNSVFFEAKYQDEIVQKKELVSTGQEALQKASAKAGIPLKELKQKLERLSTLARGEDVGLAIRMVADFDYVWLFESLLAGSTIDKDGYLIPGKPLKMFKGYAEFFGILALVNAPENTSLHASLIIKKLRYIQLNKDNFQFFEYHICRVLPNLKSKGDLYLKGLESLSDAAAEALSKHEGILDLRGLKNLSDVAAKALSKYRGDLSLGGLESLSDAAAEALSKHKGDLALWSLTSLSDAAAESLSKHNGDLRLWGLTSLSDAAAESLSKHKGYLDLDGLKSLSDAAAQYLSKHKGDLSLGGLTSLSDAAAESLSKHKEKLYLAGLTSLSDAAAEVLSKHKGDLALWSLTSLNGSFGHVALAGKLASQKGDLDLDGLKSLSDGAAEALSKHEGELNLKGLVSLSDTGAQALAKKKGGWRKLNLPDRIQEQVYKYKKK